MNLWLNGGIRAEQTHAPIEVIISRFEASGIAP